MVAFCEYMRFRKQLMGWNEEDIVRALARAGTKGLTAAALSKAISAPIGSDKFRAKEKPRAEAGQSQNA
jgi:hypothetical protein